MVEYTILMAYWHPLYSKMEIKQIIPKNELANFQDWLLKHPEAKGGHIELYNEYKKPFGDY